MKQTHLAIAVLTTCLPAFAQESYWIANRASSDIMRVSAWGSVLERVATPTTLRSCTTAPDGKVWIVRFIQPTFDIYDPSTAVLTAVASPLGNAFQIAFDAAGTAWITNSASAVHHFDSNGVFLQTIALPAGAALGITVDADGNKWIAHRATPASVSKIDPAGAVTNHLINGATTLLPGVIMADYRGLTNSSHIWVVGDSASQLAEIDVTGTTLNLYTLPATSVGSLTFDKNGDIWVGSFGNGTLLQIDETNGTVLNTYTFAPNVIGLATDSYGRVLATARTAAAPCEVRRVDPATGTLEIPARLQLGTFAAAGTQSAISTPWQYSLVVAPFGDLDGDGQVNYSEILAGTSPVDATSTSNFRIESFGVTQNGSTANFEVIAAPVQLWVAGFALALIPPTPVPGFGGTLRINPGTLVTTVAGFGNATLPIVIPLDPLLVGFEFFAQGVTFNGASFDFQNVSGMKIW
ncbi:MAG: two-component regulator propeller domain-containing protein [Planctomycetota bacterium]